MKGTGEVQEALRSSKKYFDDIRSQQPASGEKDEEGNDRPKNTIPLSELQHMKQRLEVKESEFARAPHERGARTHIKEVLRRHASEHAKKEGIQGWDDMNRRMEGWILAKKLVKNLPKNSALLRDKGKEFRQDLTAIIAGGLIGKTVGHGILGGIAGHLVERQLGHKEYKKIGSSRERKGAEKRSKDVAGILRSPVSHRKHHSKDEKSNEPHT